MSLRYYARCPRCGKHVPMTRKQHQSGERYSVTCGMPTTDAHVIVWRSEDR